MSWNPFKVARAPRSRPLDDPGDGDFPALPVVPAPLPRLDHYELLAKIARGGTATVYKARNSLTGAPVAIKVLAPQVAADAVLRQRFEQEFRAASRLHHPNIVRLLDFGGAATSPYLVMEFVEGENLGDRIEREGRLAPGEAVRLIAQVARALEYAHQEGLVHRDVKPDNILLTVADDARLTDFGLVKQLGEDVDLTAPGQGLGTLNFIAPEQLVNAKGIDRRCDVYGLGATLYMAVTGHCPFAARTPMQVFKKKIANEVSFPRAVVPTLSEHLDRVIRRAMHPDRGQRQASCAEFLHELTERGGFDDPAEATRPAKARCAALQDGAPRPPFTRRQQQDTVSALGAGPTETDLPGSPVPAAMSRWGMVGAAAFGIGIGCAVAICRWVLSGP
jgi:serine/threonine protein kinase